MYDVNVHLDNLKGERPTLATARDKIANAKLTKKITGLINEKDENGKSILHNQLINAKGVVVEKGGMALDFAKKVTKKIWQRKRNIQEKMEKTIFFLLENSITSQSSKTSFRFV